MSLPPQSYTPAHSAASADRNRQYADPPAPKHSQQRAADPTKPRTTNRILGDYTLSKTLGAGSMGKVKLAHHNVTGEKLAVKILPRVVPVQAVQGAPNAEAVAKQAVKDASKETRTIREAALSQLLYHPYICGMREMIVHQHHYYMVFEYINGGQMLDYIISHGRLRERVARKFARQIGSALEYCHKNNVVHRDLKIENILISQTGNIKIIDFGLSNLYDPVAHLTTFCGSLYFAAPELLNAKVYTGPEVDVWSFGVVLYVLVCGKVPFDDQSMPALHAKIKRGLVEYPVWLSAECKHILSRMLVTNPQQRSTLPDLLNHPWMTRGFPGPPDPHLLRREPLRADELDRQVIRGMTGFEFGTEDDIEQRLVAILDSDAYKRAVAHWESRRDRDRPRIWSESLSNSSLAIAWDGSSNTPAKEPSTPKKNKRFSGFDFYRRKLFSPASSPPTSPFASPAASQSQLSNTSLADGSQVPPDPTRGYHPLLSIYYLAREKLERDRVYGPGHFASSQLSLAPPAPVPAPAAQEEQRHTLQPVEKASGADYSMRPSRLPAPETSHYSKMSYDAPVGTPSPTAAGFAQAQSQAQARPRARDAGLPAPPAPPTVVPATPVTPKKNELTLAPPDPNAPGVPAGPASATLPRAPPASTHRRSHSVSARQGVPRGWASVFSSGTAGAHAPASAAPTDELGQLNGHEERAEEPATPQHAQGGATLVRKFGSLLVGSGSGSVRGKRASILGGFGSPRPSADIEPSEKTPQPQPQAPAQEKAHEMPQLPPPSAHRRAATVIDAKRHERRSSTGGTLLSGVGGTIGRHRRPSTSAGVASAPVTGAFGRTAEEPELEEEAQTPVQELTDGEDETGGSATEKEFKPVFLKGLFSVATTSTRAPALLKADIRRVLDRMQVQYRETKAGFDCIHAPSIDISSLQEPQAHQQQHQGGTPRRQQHRKQGSGGSGDSGGTTRRIVRKASKLSFGVRREKDKEPAQAQATSPTTPATNGNGKENGKERTEGTGGPPSSGSSSFFNVSSGAPTVHADDGASTLQAEEVAPRRSHSPARSKNLPPIPRDFGAAASPGPGHAFPTGEVDRDVLESVGQSTLAVRFEIIIVKVPWLPLHGIQFRRASGDGWQYQMLARRVLTELKL
ncbi:hypothetical protein BC834DRAFT_827457 [Gloeopeniophorella convolvens]|nr:hypothetical protein BC834DRAFT_827457 [Gloeopeniophorella convolvens]